MPPHSRNDPYPRPVTAKALPPVGAESGRADLAQGEQVMVGVCDVDELFVEVHTQ